MKNTYWFRICFKKDFESPTDANDYLEEVCKDLDDDIYGLSTDLEER